MRFAVKRKWIPDNPAAELKPPKVQMQPTMPFTHDEMVRVLTAIEAYATKTSHNGKINSNGCARSCFFCATAA